MEASENLQEQSPHGSVRAIGNRLVVEHLEVEDERAARVVRERAEAGQPAVRTVRDALEIGVRVLEREGLTTEVDYVQREFERTAGMVREQFTEQARGLTEAVQSELERVFAGESGVMAKTLDAHADELADQITRHFGETSKGAVQHQVKEMVEATMRESRESLIRHLSSDNEANPLAEFRSNVRTTVHEAVRQISAEEMATREKLGALEQQVTRLTEQADAKRQLAEAEEAGTRKGRSFEERVHDVLERIAGARGDIAHRVGDERGAGGTKKGDTVVELGACDGPALGRIVFEDKDDQLSKNKAWGELNAAMEERDAEFAVLVVAGEEKIPAGREQLVEYEGNKLIVAVDPELPDGLGLDLAYRYARLRVLMKREGELQLDAPAVRDAAEEARSALKHAQSIRLALTSIDKSSEKARDGLDTMVAAVQDRLSRIESLVSSDDETG
jgi:hypothetical protein